MPPIASGGSLNRQGLYLAFAAFGMWGLVPIYFKAVADVTALEVLAHRVVWSVVFLSGVILATGRGAALYRLLLSPKSLAMLSLSALLIGLNWLVFIWAVSHDRILETSLGYFIGPLVSVFLGTLFLAERLRGLQWLAVGLAALGVLNQVIHLGYLPWVTLSLAFSFSIYGFVRKRLGVDSTLGLSIETLLMLPLAAGYLWWLHSTGEMQFYFTGASISWLLVAAGLVTSLPLICYASAANLLPLSILGLTQYITPSTTFVLAIVVYNEAFDPGQLLTFCLIWAGLAVLTFEGLRYQRRLLKEPV